MRASVNTMALDATKFSLGEDGTLITWLTPPPLVSFIRILANRPRAEALHTIEIYLGLITPRTVPIPTEELREGLWECVVQKWVGGMGALHRAGVDGLPRRVEFPREYLGNDAWTKFETSMKKARVDPKSWRSRKADRHYDYKDPFDDVVAPDLQIPANENKVDARPVHLPTPSHVPREIFDIFQAQPHLTYTLPYSPQTMPDMIIPCADTGVSK
jgi:hypothetical protein